MFMTTVTLTAVLGILVGAAGASAKDNDLWLGTVHPDRANLTAWKHIGTFRSLQDCRKASQAHIRGRRVVECDILKKCDTVSTYECGLNCRLRYDGTPGLVFTCEKTEK